MLLALLLQATPRHFDAVTVLEVVGAGLLFIISAATGLEKIWGWFTGSAKAKDAAVQAELAELRAALGQFEDKDALERRFIGIEDKHKLTAAEIVNQHNTLMEYERKRSELTGEFRGAIGQLQKDGRALEPLPAQVADLKAKFEALTGQIKDLKEDMRANKLEVKEDMKANKGEILAAIKDLKIHP